MLPRGAPVLRASGPATRERGAHIAQCASLFTKRSKFTVTVRLHLTTHERRSKRASDKTWRNKRQTELRNEVVASRSCLRYARAKLAHQPKKRPGSRVSIAKLRARVVAALKRARSRPAAAWLSAVRARASSCAASCRRRSPETVCPTRGRHAPRVPPPCSWRCRYMPPR